MTDVPEIRRASLVQVRGLTKSYGARRVLQGIDLDVCRGAVTALIGPNGAGKTTLNKSLLGLVHPDSGSVHFDGVDTRGQVAHRARIGYMPQAAKFPDSCTARDVLALLADLRGTARARDNELVTAFALDAFLDQPVRALSGGQRQRLNSAAAFLFSPDLLLLDEPTAGLDPVASGILKAKIRSVRNAGCAVLITSHVLSELEEFTDIVVFLHEGRVRYNGTLDALRQRTGVQLLEHAIAKLMLAESSTNAAPRVASA